MLQVNLGISMKNVYSAWDLHLKVCINLLLFLKFIFLDDE